MFAMRHVTVAAVLAVAGAGYAFAQAAAPAKPASAAKPAATPAAPAAKSAAAAAPAAAATPAKGGPMAGQTVRIAFMDPLSGPFANVGQNQLKSWQFAAEQLGNRAPSGVKFEVVGFDNKGSPQESLNTVKAAIDQGLSLIHI